MQLEILYQDEDIVVVNKPAGLLIVPDRFHVELPSLHRVLQHQLKQKLWIVHRLDRGTSGVTCFARNEVAHRHLSLLFQQHQVGKFYAGLVNGVVQPDQGRIEAAITEDPSIKGKMMVARKGKASVTDYRVTEQWPLYALVQFQIHTGRTHQIRVHLKSIGHPIVCDELYGDGRPFYLSTIKRKYKLSGKEEEEKPLLSRLALHAYRLELSNPNGREITVEADLPKDIIACVKQLRKWTS